MFHWLLLLSALWILALSALLDVLSSHGAVTMQEHGTCSESKKIPPTSHSARGTWSPSAGMFELLSVSETALSTYSTNPFSSCCAHQDGYECGPIQNQKFI